MNNSLHLEGDVVEIKGATKMVSSTPTQAVVEIDEKAIILTGNNIEVKKLDLDNKQVSLGGKFSNIKIGDASLKKGSLLKRIFK